MRLILGTLLAIFAVTLSLAVFEFISYHNEQHNCSQIELIKTRVRKNAIDSYKKLPQTAKLIGVKVTPELRRVALGQEQRTLDEYSASRCAGLFG